MENLIKVSVIIPCRNEQEFIAKCIDSVLSNDFPNDKIEIIIVDGESNDKTREIVKEYSEKYSFIKLLNNPKKIAASALNIGIKEAKGGIIIRMDAHAIYNNDYISKCVYYLEKYNADNVGGIISITPRLSSIMSRGIVKAMSSFLGTGGAKYKLGLNKFEEVDTVPFGCFKKELFNRVGYFNENLLRSQDMEFNLRLKRAGGKIYLFPDIISHYYVRSDLKDFFLHNFKDGVWAIYPFKFTKKLFKLRHYMPLTLVLGLLILLFLGLFLKPILYLFYFICGLYLLILAYSSIRVSINEKDATYLVSLPIALFTRHFAYGFGSIFGIMKLLK
jgi:cellulose synthase/poly-beta-1,6-N-acetylglucosamine synthase-like glycosyltransferase